MPNLAVIEADLALVGATGITAKLFTPLTDTIVGTVNTWTEATNRVGVFTASQALGLTGLQYIVFFNSAGKRCGSGWVYMTDEANVHLVVGYASVLNRQGGTVLLGPGSSANTLDFVFNSVPAANAKVWLTSDQAGTTVVAGVLYTDSNGKVTFMLTPGNIYYIWFVCPGYQSIQGQAYTAS